MKKLLKRIITVCISASLMLSAFPVARAANSTTESNMEITDITVGSVTSFTLKLTAPDTISGVVFIAKYYNGTSTLASVEKFNAVAEQDFEINTPNGENVKVMWWSDTTTIDPLTDSYVVDEVLVDTAVSSLMQTLDQWAGSADSTSVRQSASVNYQALTSVNFDF